MIKTIQTQLKTLRMPTALRSLIEAKYKRFEPAQIPENTKRMAQIDTIRSTWRGRVDEFRTFCVESTSGSHLQKLVNTLNSTL